MSTLPSSLFHLSGTSDPGYCIVCTNKYIPWPLPLGGGGMGANAPNNFDNALFDFYKVEKIFRSLNSICNLNIL